MIVETLKALDIKGEELSSISGTHRGKERTDPGKLFSDSARVSGILPYTGMYILEHRCAHTHAHTHRHTHFKEYFD